MIYYTLVGKRIQYRYVGVCVLSRVRLFATPWTVAYQAPLSMEFSRQELYWSGLLFPLPGTLPYPGIETATLASPSSQLFYHFFFNPFFFNHFFTTEPPGKPPIYVQDIYFMQWIGSKPSILTHSLHPLPWRWSLLSSLTCILLDIAVIFWSFGSYVMLAYYVLGTVISVRNNSG